MNRLPSWHRALLNALARRALPLLLALTGLAGAVVPLAAAVAATGTVDAIVVRLRDDALAPDATRLPEGTLADLSAVAQSALTATGRTRDGAFTLQLAPPLSFEDARAAVNRLRMLSQVLYVNVAPAAPAAGTSPFPVFGSPQPAVTRMMIKYRDPALTALSNRGGMLGALQLDRLALNAGQSIAHERAMSGGAFVVRLFTPVPAVDAVALARILEADPDVEYAEPDLRMYPQAVPTDPLYASSQWDLKTPAQSAGGANLPPAWDITTGSASIRVAVLDTGILPHPDLIGRYAGGYDMINDALVGNDGDVRDGNPVDPGDWITAAESAQLMGYFEGCSVGNSSWHGTHVAGTIAAATNNGIGISGINWVSQILPVRVLGKCGGYTSDIADAIRWAAGLSVPGAPANTTPARVINLSLGGGGACDATSQGAITAAIGAGTLLAISAGNSNADASGSSPANCVGVITVAATQAAGARASYSNFGTTVEIAAPGGGDGIYIRSTLNSGATTADPAGYYYEYYQGTSMAAPHVAGIASLMLSINPAMTPAQVLSTIQTTARAFPTGTGRDCTANPAAAVGSVKYCGAGIIDAGAAVAAALALGGGGGPVATTTTLGSAPNPATAGAVVTFTASVTGSNPAGTVNFLDGGAPMAGCSTATLSGSGNTRTATCSTTALAVGVHSIVASYAGNAGNNASSSAALSQVITLAAGSTSTVLTGSPNPSSVGASVTLTATVTGTAPTGTVGFVRGNVFIPGCNSVALTGSGNVRSAQCTFAFPALGSSVVYGFYSGGPGNNASSGQMTQVVQVATGAPTTTTVASSLNPSTVGQSVTFTASVTGTAPGGSVGFTDNGTPISGCTAVALVGGSSTRTAQCSTAGLSVGARTIAANYGGDAANLASNGSVAQTVNAAAATATTTSVASSLNPSTAGVSVTFTASVTGTAPTGTVAFTDNGGSISGCTAVALAGSGSTRTAQCSTAALPVGTRTIAAAYGGNAGNLASNGNLAQVVNAAAAVATTTTLASSQNPSTVGASVTLTASVTGVAPAGNVAFSDNGTAISGCTAVALTGSGNTRTAQCSTSALAVGAHPLVAAYAGNAGNLASSSTTLTQTVNAVVVGGTNVALASAGAVASASSTSSALYPAAAINNDNRAGTGFGSGGVWNDGTINEFPDWVQIDFSGTRTIDRVVVYSAQDNQYAPVEPSDTMTFTLRGLTAFTVQGWNGSAWVTLASVSGNNLVKRSVVFSPYATQRIRVNVTGTLGARTYMTEVEAWGS